MAGGAALIPGMTFDEGWTILQEEAVNKMINIFEAEEHPNHKLFNSQEYIRFHTVVYHVCCSKRSNHEIQKLYDQYKRTFEDYLSYKVLPSLRGKSDENLLRELLRRWRNHKIMTKFHSMFLHYLSRYYIPTMKLPSLVETSHLVFYNLVYKEIKDQVCDITVSLIDRERNGEWIDQAMVREVIDICEEIGGGVASKHYAKDIEEAPDEATSKFTCLRLGNA